MEDIRKPGVGQVGYGVGRHEGRWTVARGAYVTKIVPTETAKGLEVVYCLAPDDRPFGAADIFRDEHAAYAEVDKRNRAERASGSVSTRG